MNKEKEAIMKDKIKNILDVTFWKFVLVGIVNTLVGTAVMFAAYNVLHLSYWISSASNYVVGSIVSYFLNKYFTFPMRISLHIRRICKVMAGRSL